jgi:uncharacterized membrane protein YeaQ/YmgE (transglycosylase-associated protein family)
MWFLIIGAVAGWLAGQFMRGNGFGLIGDLCVGVTGACVAGYLFPAIGLNFARGLAGTLIAAFLGAVVLLFVVRLFTGRRSGRRVWS